ncbi:MAG: aminoglycoside phosphotransferase family protein, partial [Bacteroidetes bacterium]|nr:aminoglycoside phosphotransferase family protein [Bacteroidota bacterium]
MNKNTKKPNNNIYYYAAQLTKKAGIKGVISLSPMECGGNNRVFRVDIGKKRFLLKSYFHDNRDPRDRLGHEFAFTSFAWEHGVKAVPQPLASDHTQFLGLYEFINGSKIGSGDVTWEHVRQALDFFLYLNRHNKKPAAGALPTASEACFSVADHVSCVDRRLKQLRGIKSSDAIDMEAVDFIGKELLPTWKNVREGALMFAKDLGIEINQHISIKERCLSPSDFGFHNAILENSGALRFVDFEYAGWDDPAKMVCDFFCQPEVRVPFEHFHKFFYEVHVSIDEPENFEDRVSLLFYVYRIKWCCIMLNEFLPVYRQRRKYALDSVDQRE